MYQMQGTHCNLCGSLRATVKSMTFSLIMLKEFALEISEEWGESCSGEVFATVKALSLSTYNR